MSEIIKLPDIGDIDSAEVIEILVKAGDTVAAEDPLITLESDKAAMDIPSPRAGTVENILITVGDRLAEGADIISLTPSDNTQDTATESDQTTADDARTESSTESTTENKAENTKDNVQTEPQPEPKQTNKKTAPDSQPHTRSHGKAHAGPAVRKLARKLGVDLNQVSGTGPKHRILKEDVQHYVKQCLSEDSSSFNLPPKPEIDFSQFGDIETQELSKIQRLTGLNTHRSWVSLPHVTQFDRADITELEDFRQSIKADYAEQNIKLTLLPFIIKAVVSSLKAYPRFNSSLDHSGENLILKHYCNIGVAVDTPQGLVVPVIKQADCKSITDIAQDIAHLAEAAKSKKIKTQDMQGGCFTVSSLGHLSGTGFTPIINEPEVAILGLSPAQITPIYNGDSFQPRLMLPLSLSYDHRVIDGVLAAKFTQHLGEVLQDARKMLL